VKKKQDLELHALMLLNRTKQELKREGNNSKKLKPNLKKNGKQKHRQRKAKKKLRCPNSAMSNLLTLI
jgi:GTPase SAR1 family protein